jgi:diacylglycerol kinase (ATP)
LLRDQHNAWLHLGATAAAFLTGLSLRVYIADWRWRVLAAALVWMAEAINTAVEELCDRLYPGLDPVSGGITDLAAGAMLVPRSRPRWSAR